MAAEPKLVRQRSLPGVTRRVICVPSRLVRPSPPPLSPSAAAAAPAAADGGAAGGGWCMSGRDATVEACGIGASPLRGGGAAAAAAGPAGAAAAGAMQRFHLGAVVGVGSYGMVYECVEEDTGITYAVKVLREAPLHAPPSALSMGMGMNMGFGAAWGSLRRLISSGLATGSSGGSGAASATASGDSEGGMGAAAAAAAATAPAAETGESSADHAAAAASTPSSAGAAAAAAESRTTTGNCSTQSNNNPAPTTATSSSTGGSSTVLREKVRREVEFLRLLQPHPHIVHLHCAHQDRAAAYVFTEYCLEGDLHHKIATQGPLPERDAAEVFAQLASALAFCHAHGVAHRDVKLENVLVARCPAEFSITCAAAPPAAATAAAAAANVAGTAAWEKRSFSTPTDRSAWNELEAAVGHRGESGHGGGEWEMAGEARVRSSVGTHAHGLAAAAAAASPSAGAGVAAAVSGADAAAAAAAAGEGQTQFQPHKADAWSLGVVLYALLSGRLPFLAQTDAELAELISQGEVDLEEDPWHDVGNDAKRLLLRLLVLSPGDRAAACDVLDDPWLLRHGVGVVRRLK
ncbi:unnamed protein product [Closterium sp. NIES-64]|nr:unnamed protein product [Closterium sp. NIES-64]